MPDIHRAAYIAMRQRAWAARKAGDIAEAQHEESNAEQYGYKFVWADDCDALADNPGTSKEDWAKLSRKG